MEKGKKEGTNSWDSMEVGKKCLGNSPGEAALDHLHGDLGWLGSKFSAWSSLYSSLPHSLPSFLLSSFLFVLVIQNHTCRPSQWHLVLSLEITTVFRLVRILLKLFPYMSMHIRLYMEKYMVLFCFDINVSRCAYLLVIGLVFSKIMICLQKLPSATTYKSTLLFITATQHLNMP